MKINTVYFQPSSEDEIHFFLLVCFSLKVDSFSTVTSHALSLTHTRVGALQLFQ